MTVYAALAFMPVFQRKGNRKEVGVQRGAAVKMEVTGKAWLRQGSSRWVYKWEPPLAFPLCSTIRKLCDFGLRLKAHSLVSIVG